MVQNYNKYDAEFCGRLPIHLTNAIQPHGVYFLLSETLDKVLQVSENVADLTGLQPEKVAGQSPEQILVSDSLVLIKATADKGFDGKIPIKTGFVRNESVEWVTSLIHRIPEGLALEAELPAPHTSGQLEFSDVYRRVKTIFERIENSGTVEDAYEICVKELKEVSGFEKVMIYRFDENWNGTVVAEIAEEGMELYKGLTFPASDIPKPARDMYQKNAYRLIPNREYKPVKLYPILNPVSNAFTSLLHADLRSVAQVHLEYLKNMNVMASMSARLMSEGRLMGLIAFHHREARYISYDKCSIVEMISNLLAQRINAFENSDKIRLRERLADKYAVIVEHLADNNSILEAFLEHSVVFSDFFNTDGIALSWNGQIAMHGATPEKNEIDTLVYWLSQKTGSEVYTETALPAVFDEARTFANGICGVMALPIQPEKGNYLIAFRKENVYGVAWGGNPAEAIRFEPGSKVYHPRHSFSIWNQTIRETSVPWHREEIAIASQLRNFLVQHTLNRLN